MHRPGGDDGSRTPSHVPIAYVVIRMDARLVQEQAYRPADRVRWNTLHLEIGPAVDRSGNVPAAKSPEVVLVFLCC